MYSFTQIYERAREIQSRFQSSDRHGVIYCINRLMTVKMKDETVVGAHTFTDEVSSLMLRLKGHLREGGLDVLTVMEIMVLIEGLPKSGPFALFALASSTDENLTASQFIERLHRQSKRLAREQLSIRVSEGKTEDAGTRVANSVGGGGGQANPDQPANKVKPPPTYWNGQQSKATYQSAHWDDEGEVETDSQTQERGHNTDRGRGRDPPRGYRLNNRQHRRASTNAVKDKYDDNEEMGFIFKVQGVDMQLSTPRHAFEHQRQLINDSTCFKRKFVDALAPPYRNVDALAPSYRNVEAFAPDCFNVDAFHPPLCSVDISAPVQVSVDAPAPVQVLVDATAPVQDSVDATAPGRFSVDAPCLAPVYSNVEALAPECSYPDSSVEAHIMKLPSSELVPEKSSDASEVVAKCPHQDNIFDNAEFNCECMNYGVHFARRQI